MYIAIIHKDPDSDYGVYFPDVPGCFSAGSTLEEARRMATEALAAHVETLRDEGMDVPPARHLDDLVKDPDIRDDLARGAMTMAIPLLATGGRKKRIDLVLESDLVNAIDDYAKSVGMTRTAFLSQAARHELIKDAG